MAKAKETIISWLKEAGIEVNGPAPYDIQVNNEKLYSRIIGEGSLGLGEAYMDGWWDVKDMAEFFNRILRSRLDKKIKLNFKVAWLFLKSYLFNMQNRKKGMKVAEKHYNLDNDLYMSFLDPYNQYTCGYFKDTEDLNKAQEQKLELLCKKLQLKKTDKVLDIGCGWGGFAKYASERYGCTVTGISISDEQISYAKEYCKGLPVTILKMNYRDLKEKFDKVVIVGMIEHVGYKNYKTIFNIVNKSLKKDGLFVLHTIGGEGSVRGIDSWIEKYIFPNSMLPSVKQIADAAEGLFIMEDWHNFSAYYDKTLHAWKKNFLNSWDILKIRYDERFKRMWIYYFMASAGSFRSRRNQLWQVVFSKKGVSDVYNAPR